MTIFEQVMQTCPELPLSEFRQYVTLRDDSDGLGPYIERWDHPTIPRPSIPGVDELSAAKAAEKA